MQKQVGGGVVVAMSLLMACGAPQSGSPNPKDDAMCMNTDAYMDGFNQGASLDDTCLTWPGADGKAACGASGWSGWSPSTHLCGPVLGTSATCDGFDVTFLAIEDHCVAVETTNVHAPS